MKIVILGDALVSASSLLTVAQNLNFPNPDNQPVTFQTFEWFANLTKPEFQAKILEIESFGPENLPLPAGFAEAMTTADYLLVHIAPVPQRVIEGASHLKLIGTCRGGLEHIALECCRQQQIKLIHVIRNAEPVADFTLGMIIAETRNIARSHYGIKQGQWLKTFPNDPYKTTLDQLTVSLIGLGHIGKRLARKLSALNMTVLAHDPFVSAADLEGADLPITLVSLQEAFKQGDVISLHLRLTPDTYHFVDEALLSLMTPNSYLINSARAGLIKKSALLTVLQKQQIAGAALDVAWIEPLPADDPFLSLDNVTLTSHLAGDTIDAIPRSPEMLAHELRTYFATGKSDYLYLS